MSGPFGEPPMADAPMFSFAIPPLPMASFFLPSAGDCMAVDFFFVESSCAMCCVSAMADAVAGCGLPID